ncbi:MAG: universal stress protein [Chloroflexota bacterium]
MRIVVAFDGSDGAESALRAALQVAAASNGQLLLVRAFNPLYDAANIVAPSTAAAAAVVTEDWQRMLDECVQQIDGVPAEARVQVTERGEDTGPALVRAARAWDADLIAIASRRATGLSGALLGSVAAGVVNASDCPVILVHA